MKKYGQTRTAPASPEAGFASTRLGQRLRAVMDEGSASNRAVAEYLLRNPVRAAGWGIEELAEQADTSTATLSRFARHLGFAGFAALRGALAEALQQALQPVFQPVEKLRDAVERGAAGASDAVAAEAMQAVLANVQSTAAGLDATVLARVAQQIAQAEVVYTMGFGISAHLAAMLELDLQPFCRLVNVVEYGGTEVAAGRLMNVGQGDLLIVISFPRYASDAITLAQYARDRGARVVAITDSPASPLTGPAHDVLVAASTHPVLSSSATAAVLVIESLVAALMVARRSNVRQAQKLTDAISGYLYAKKGR